jgi:hypothetical protein
MCSCRMAFVTSVSIGICSSQCTYSACYTRSLSKPQHFDSTSGDLEGMQPTELVQEISVTPDVALSVRKRRLLLIDMTMNLKSVYPSFAS